jgi:hypothetical protein
MKITPEQKLELATKLITALNNAGLISGNDVVELGAYATDVKFSMEALRLGLRFRKVCEKFTLEWGHAIPNHRACAQRARSGGYMLGALSRYLAKRYSAAQLQRRLDSVTADTEVPANPAAK